jgi:hypothetical protein
MRDHELPRRCDRLAIKTLLKSEPPITKTKRPIRKNGKRFTGRTHHGHLTTSRFGWSRNHCGRSAFQ